jgi:glycosyltransferase involved in cell wall biosynthesis
VPDDGLRYAVIGSGIGSLASELASRHPTAEIVGFDPDSTSTDVATILFDHPNLSFAAGPDGAEALAGFDVLVVAPGATALPSTAAAPSSARPRVVTLEPRDRRGGGQAADRGDRRRRADPARRDRVVARLGIHVTADGYLVARQGGPRVAIAMPVRGASVETFIRAQIERLPANVSLIIGDVPHLTDEDGTPLVPRIGRAGRGAVERVLGGRATHGLDQFWLRRHLKSREFDVVLAEYGPRGVQMLAACNRTGTPLVTHFYGYDASARTNVKRVVRAYRRLFRRGGPLVVVSQDMASRLTSIGADPAAISVIACGVDPQPASVTPAFTDPPVFLAAGRFVEKKAPHMTLLAFSALVRDVPDARMKMVGDGPLLGPCRQLAKALGIESRVEFMGSVPHEQLLDLYGSSRAFVQHSMEASNGDSEGVPVAILEAGAAGLPVVATRHAGIPEAVIDGETGYLVPEGGIDEMADRMRALASDRTLAERLGSTARRHVTANFDLDDSLHRLLGVLESAVNPAPRGASGRRSQAKGR